VASRRKGRIAAFQALYCWEVSKPPVADLLEFAWLDAEKLSRMGDAGLAFSRNLASGSIENVKIIDKTITNHLENWDIARLNRVDLAILRMSVYTLIFQKDIAPSIVIDEAVGISRDFGSDDSYRFINGVLDSIRKTSEREGLGENYDAQNAKGETLFV
jgi:N utilization substance protein B